jgi:hypothetical protein
MRYYKYRNRVLYYWSCKKKFVERECKISVSALVRRREANLGIILSSPFADNNLDS